MTLQNYYWYFRSAIPPRICDEIIQHGLSKKESFARTGDYDKKSVLSENDINEIKQIRNSDIVWLDDLWIYQQLHPYLHQANAMAGWNYTWDRSESCQFTKYKLNQYYDWHCDSHNETYKIDGPENGKIRKLSMTCQLTDGSEYRGGELEFDFRNNNPTKRNENEHVRQCMDILPKGSIVVFPSFVWHRVKPVTSGTRYSLVMWSLGYPFK